MSEILDDFDRKIHRARRVMIFKIVVGLSFLITSIMGFFTGFQMTRTEIMLVLAFHGVTEKPFMPWEIRKEKLFGILDGLRRSQFEPSSPEEFEQWMGGFIRGGRRFLVTFDDGLKTSGQAIRDLKKERGITSAIFVVTDFMGKEGYLSRDELAQLASDTGCRLALHGKRHYELPKIASEGGDITAELLEGKRIVEGISGLPISWFAYSFGENDIPSRNAVASAGLRFGFTIEPKPVSRDGDLLRLGRLMYLSGTENSGEPSADDWMPPPEARTGSMLITVAILVFLWGLSQLAQGYRIHLAIQGVGKESSRKGEQP